MSKINMNQVLKQLNGEELKEADGTPLTLGTVCITALLNDNEGSGADKVLKYRMAQKLYAGGEVVLKSEELTALKNIVGRTVTSTIHAGQAMLMLEPTEE